MPGVFPVSVRFFNVLSGLTEISRPARGLLPEVVDAGKGGGRSAAAGCDSGGGGQGVRKRHRHGRRRGAQGTERGISVAGRGTLWQGRGMAWKPAWRDGEAKRRDKGCIQQRASEMDVPRSARQRHLTDR